MILYDSGEGACVEWVRGWCWPVRRLASGRSWAWPTVWSGLFRFVLAGSGGSEPEEIVSGFPDRFLLADKVGLGKTIEVCLPLRDLTLSGVVEHCLILTPRSVLNQWRDELREKFLLTAREYDGARSLGDGSLELVSGQLAKRRELREEFLNGPEWDLVVVDEAHHARCKGFIDPRRRANRLLELLEGVDGLPGWLPRPRGLLLLTATPMQVHALEVWDLLIARRTGAPRVPISCATSRRCVGRARTGRRPTGSWSRRWPETSVTMGRSLPAGGGPAQGADRLGAVGEIVRPGSCP